MKIKDFLEKYGDVDITKDNEKELKKLLNIKDNNKWKPKCNGIYYFIDSSGIIIKDIWSSHSTDDNRYINNNCFNTREVAEYRLEQIKVYNELKNFALENNDEIKWSNDNSKTKYCIFYDYTLDKICVERNTYARSLGQIYFSSEELAKKAIEKVGEERIKKYLFGVNDEKED